MTKFPRLARRPEDPKWVLASFLGAFNFVAAPLGVEWAPSDHKRHVCMCSYAFYLMVTQDELPNKKSVEGLKASSALPEP